MAEPEEIDADVTAPHAGGLVLRLAEAMLANVDREYPNQVIHLAHGAAELQAPRVRHPVFYGCFDWHSAVHSHWALLRVRRIVPALRARIDAALVARVTPEGVERELAYLVPRPRFELPYGLAWLLLLCAEASRSGDVGASVRRALAPLEALARDRIASWARGLPAPIRAGEHSSSAFAMTLALDWARIVGDAEVAAGLVRVARAFHAGDRDAPWAYEPSAYDFVSPGLATAWLMTRVETGAAYARWLDGYAPALGRGLAFTVPVAADRVDGKLVHWDGLALSRAWMLVEIARALPDRDPRASELVALGDAHGSRGLASLDDASYAGSHWLPSFALYWIGAKSGLDRPLS
jgi:hypothetical protein